MEGAGHGLGHGRPVQGYLAGDKGAAPAHRIDPADQAAAGQQRHHEVAVHALGLRHVGLQAVLEAEQPRRPLAVPDERVERRQQRDPVPFPVRSGRGGHCCRIGPGGDVGPRPGDRRRHQARGPCRVIQCRRTAVARRQHPLQPVVVDEVGVRGRAEGSRGDSRQVAHAGFVGRVHVQQTGRDDPLRQVVDSAPAGPADADKITDVEQPLGRDLDLRPVPPGAAALRATELGGGHRPLGGHPGQDLPAHPRGHLMPAHPAGPEPAPPEGVVRPFLDRQHAGRVCPVFEGRRMGRIPVRALDPGPGHWPEARVGDQLVGASQHADRVELDPADPAQHPRHAALAG